MLVTTVLLGQLAWLSLLGAIDHMWTTAIKGEQTNNWGELISGDNQHRTLTQLAASPRKALENNRHEQEARKKTTRASNKNRPRKKSPTTQESSNSTSYINDLGHKLGLTTDDDVEHSIFSNISSLDRTTKEDRPIAIVHVGPAKTGSTHLQVVLASKAARMEQAGFHFPKSQHKFFLPKDMSGFYDELSRRAGGSSNTFSDFLKKKLAQKRNVVITAENLAAINIAAVRAMKNMLNGFKVKIIMIYRDELTRVESGYHAHSARLEIMQPFSLYTLDRLKGAKELWEYMINKFASVFSEDGSIVLLDYYGMISAGKDVGYVVLCEVMGILCTETAHLNVASDKQNSAKDILPRLLLDEILKLAAGQKCSLDIGRSSMKKMRDMLAADTAAETETGRALPTKEVAMEALMIAAKEVDDLVRSKYGEILLYGNSTANKIARENLRFRDLATWDLHASSYWREWMLNELEKLKHEGLLKGCKL